MDLVRPASLARRGFWAASTLLLAGCLMPPPRPGSTAAQSSGTAPPGGQSSVFLKPPAVPAAPDGPRPFEHDSAELMARLRVGWNLGNSLDVPDSETAWGNPPATPQLMQTVVYWDNGSRNSGGESFGLFDRRDDSVLHPHVLQAIMRAAAKDYSLADIAPPRPAQ